MAPTIVDDLIGAIKALIDTGGDGSDAWLRAELRALKAIRRAKRERQA